MKKNPLVSIITPSFNQGEFVRETIESVLGQDYPNIEYIIIDGGSTDNTIKIIKEYGDKIKWISEKDRGQADAINKGITMSKGEIIGWLNSDDTYLSGAVRKAVRHLQSHFNLGVVYGEGYHISITGDIVDRYPTEEFDYNRLAETCFICQPTAFIRKAVIEDVGMLDEDLQLCLDYELWMRIGRKYEIGYMSEFLATSRMYKENKTLSRRGEVFDEALKITKRYYNYVPLSWIYGYVEFLMPGKTGLYFIIRVFMLFMKCNMNNILPSIKNTYGLIKRKLKYTYRQNN